MKFWSKQSIAEVVGLVGLGVLSRLWPHLPNFTAIGAIALRARVRFGLLGLALPLGSMLVTDLALGFYSWRLMLSVYGAIGLAGWLGRWLTGSPSGRRLVLVASGSSIIFFLITNFTVWIVTPWFEKSLWGLLTAYILGLPFLASMMAGDVFYTVIVFNYQRAFKFAKGRNIRVGQRPRLI